MLTNDPTRSFLAPAAPLAPLLAISVRQPWATSIMLGKNVENRNWNTSYRGPLVIHAGSSRASLDRQCDAVKRLGFPIIVDMPFGAFLGVVDLVDCIKAKTKAGRALALNNPWADRDSEFYFMLDNPRPFAEPISGPGALSLFKIDSRVSDAARLLIA